MSKKLITYIGRFQLPHLGHHRNFKEGLRIAKEQGGEFLCIIGSCDVPRTHKNLFTYEERCQMIKLMFPNEKIHFEKSVDFFDDKDWLKDTVSIIENKYREINSTCNFIPSDVTVVCHEKEDSVWYTSMLKDVFRIVDIGPYQLGGATIESTSIREMYINNPAVVIENSEFGFCFREYVDQNIIPFLINFASSNLDKLKEVKDEMKYYENYRNSFSGPYPVQFLAADSLFVHNGLILLGRRKNVPGKGLLAIPGGFVNSNETFLKAAKRELEEETCLLIKDNADYRSMIFDNPRRSLRGRVVTNAFLFNSSESNTPPSRAQASDDLEKLEWIKISDIKKYRDQLFEDHYFIITEMTGIK